MVCLFVVMSFFFLVFCSFTLFQCLCANLCVGFIFQLLENEANTEVQEIVPNINMIAAWH